MPLPSGNRIYDEAGAPINSANPLQVSLGGGITLTVSNVGINTITSTNPMPVSFPSDPLTVTVNIGSLVDTNYSNMQKIVNATDFTQSITYAYHTTTSEYYVAAIAYQSVTEALSLTEAYLYTGTDTSDFRVVSIGLS